MAKNGIQRIILLEGVPESGIATIARELKQRIPGALLCVLPYPLEDRPPDLLAEIRELVFDQPNRTLIFTHTTPLERLHQTEDPKDLAELELYLGEHAAFAFFLKGTAAFFARRGLTTAEALRVHSLQIALETAYLETRFLRRFTIALDGSTPDRLADTICFQANLITWALESAEPEDSPDPFRDLFDP